MSDTSKLPSFSSSIVNLEQEKYKIQQVLGSGGMGTVYLGTCREDGRTVAIKTIHSGRAEEKNIARFRREYRVLSQLNHDNIIKVFDFYTAQQTYYLVMEYVEGKNLDDYLFPSSHLHQHPHINPEKIRQALEVTVQVCQALAYLHNRKIVHRDLKPGNIMVTKDGIVKLLDFGLGKELDVSVAQTESGVILGSLAYMSPEQIKDPRNIDHRSDLFSLGVLLFELLTGRLPFDGDNFTDILMKVLFEEPSQPSQLNNYISPKLERLIYRLLCKDLTERYASAEKVMKEIGKILETDAQEVELSDRTQTVLAEMPAESSMIVFEPQFVGRSAELSQLRKLVKDIIDGGGNLVVVTGETGVGKSRLVSEVETYSKLKGVRALRGYCYEGETIPFYPFQSIFRQIYERLKKKSPEYVKQLLGRGGRFLSKIALEFREFDLDTGPADETTNPDQEKLHLFTTIANILRQWASESPILLIMEDLEWSDQTTMELLQFLIRNLMLTMGESLGGTPQRMPILFIVTFKNDLAEAPKNLTLLKNNLLPRQSYQEITLFRMNQAEVEAMLTSMLGKDVVSPWLLQQIYNETEGNPFFIRETIHNLVEEGVLVFKDDRWRLELKNQVSKVGTTSDSRDAYRFLTIPSNIKLLLEKRLVLIDEDDRKTLNLAAVIGKIFTFDELVEVTGHDEDELLDAIDNLLKAKILVEKQNIHGEYYEFAHMKLKDICLEQLSQRRLVRTHLKVAKALEKLYSQRLDEYFEALAFHYTEAKKPELAWKYYEKSGDKAQAVFNNEVAIGDYEQALEQIRMIDNDELADSEINAAKTRILKKLGRIYVRMGRYTLAESHLDSLKQTADMYSLMEAKAEALMMMSEISFANSEYDKARKLALDALHIYKENKILSGVGHCYIKLVGIQKAQGHYEAATKNLESALNLYRHLNDQNGIGTCLNEMGIVHFLSGNFDKAQVLYEQSLKIRKSSGHKLGEASSLSNLAGVFMMKGEHERVLAYLNQAKQAFHEAGAIREEGMILSNIGITYLNQGKLQEALDYSNASLKIFEEINDKPTISSNYNTIGEVHYYLADYEKSLQAFQQTLRLSKDIGNRYDELYYYLNGGQVYFCLGEMRTALEHIEQARILAEKLKHQNAIGKVLCYTGLILGYRSDFGNGLKKVKQGLKLALDSKDEELEIECRCALCSIALLTGKGEAALKNSKRILEYAEKNKSPFYHAQGHFFAGAGYLINEKLDEAELDLNQSKELLTSLNTPENKWQVHRYLARLSVRRSNLAVAVDEYSIAQNVLYVIQQKIQNSEYRNSFLLRRDRIDFIKEVEKIVDATQQI